jgi:hypothetical protein
MRMKELDKTFQTGNLVIFVGAGLSASVGFPTAQELFQLLLNQDKNHKHIHENVETLAGAADWCEATNDVEWFHDTILRIIHDEEFRFIKTRKISPSHAIFGKLPPVEIITTKWDTLVEQYGVSKVIYMSDKPPDSEESPVLPEVIHIHNDHGTCLIASTKDLMRYEKEEPGWGSHLHSVLNNKVILTNWLMIGY